MERDSYFDNAKAILITLVVIGHIIEPFVFKHVFFKKIYMFIYVFHMPCFILITGYFAKYIKDMNKARIKYILLYLALSAALWPFSGYGLMSVLVSAYSLSWYLVSLYFWYVLLPIFQRLKYPVLIALLISLTVGYFSSWETLFSASRTVVFFPFFLIGHKLNKDHFNQLITLKPEYAAVALLSIYAIISLFPFDPNWFFGSQSYLSLGWENSFAALCRIGIYLLSSVAIIGFLVIVPRRSLFFTALGRHTLIIYLAHGVLLKILRFLI